MEGMQMRNWKRKLAVGTAVATMAVGSTAAWGWLTGYGEGASSASVAENKPAVDGGVTVNALLADKAGAATITVTNDSGEDISIETIPVGVSRAYVTGIDGDTFTCPAGSVTVGALDEGAIVPVTDASGVADTNGQRTIPDGEQAIFNVYALFDTSSAAFSNVN
jgi:hypothetical protein